MTFGVLGPVAAWGADGVALDLKGPRHRAVLARLAVARGRVVPLRVLIEDLWESPPAGAAGAIRTFADEPWAGAERARLAELRLALIERQAEARLALGLAAQAVPDLQANVTGHPWREEAWRLLALALYRGGRQAEALDVIRRARSLLAAELGLDPGPSLAALEAGILRQAAHLDAPADDVLAVTAAAYQRAAPGFTRTRLESAATLAGSLALTGGSGLPAAMSQRLAAIEAAEKLGDPELTARVIGNFDVPAVWTHSDDPAAAERIVAAAERTLSALPAGRDALRARLLATIAVESRGDPGRRPGQAAAEAETIARRLGDPALLAFALNGTWMQSFSRTGLAGRRDAVGGEIVTLAGRHGLVNFEILGRLIRLQALSGLGDFTGADAQAAALDQLGEVQERPGVGVFTHWYVAMRTAATEGTSAAEESYRRAATLLDHSGMPGVARGLLPMALLCLRVWRHEPAGFPGDTDWGPYHAWARPWLLLAGNQADEAKQALRHCPSPPPGLLAEALWSLTARAAVALDDRASAAAARDALAPARAEIAGAGSGMLTAGPVSDYLTELDRLLLPGEPRSPDRPAVPPGR